MKERWTFQECWAYALLAYQPLTSSSLSLCITIDFLFQLGELTSTTITTLSFILFPCIIISTIGVMCVDVMISPFQSGTLPDPTNKTNDLANHINTSIPLVSRTPTSVNSIQTPPIPAWTSPHYTSVLLVGKYVQIIVNMELFAMYLNN